MKRNFYTTKPRKIQGFNVGKDKNNFCFNATFYVMVNLGRQFLDVPNGNPLEVSRKHLGILVSNLENNKSFSIKQF